MRHLFATHHLDKALVVGGLEGGRRDEPAVVIGLLVGEVGDGVHAGAHPIQRTVSQANCHRVVDHIFIRLVDRVDLLDNASEGAATNGVDGDGGGLTQRNLRNINLGHLDGQLQLAHIGQGNDRFADRTPFAGGDIHFKNRAFDGGCYLRTLQFGLRFFQIQLGFFDLRLGAQQVGARGASVEFVHLLLGILHLGLRFSHFNRRRTILQGLEVAHCPLHITLGFLDRGG